MKKILKSCMIALLIIFCLSCRKNVVNEENKQEVSIVNEDNQDTIIQSYPLEEKTAWGIICRTNITDDNVNVRISPSLEAKVVYKLQNNDIVLVRGFSNETMTIDGYNGNWVNIHYTDRKTIYIEGWVFSKYVNIGDMKPAPIKFVEMLPNKEKPEKIRLSFNLEGEEIFRDVEFTQEGGIYYVIVWGTETFGYHYRSIPGVYFLNKDTYELQHFTYSGAFSDGAVAWLKFTYDFKYVIQDSGTSSGIRGIMAWRCSTNETVFQGIYYNYSRINGHTIDVVYMYDEFDYERGFTDYEIMQYGKKFTEENPIPEDIEEKRIKTGLSLEIIIKCTINLDTGERTIIGGEYILTQ